MPPLTASNTNPVIAFPASRAELRLAQSAGALTASQAAERHNLELDLEALRDRENNLRDYEARLRSWQTQLENTVPPQPPTHYVAPVAIARSTSHAPFENEMALQAGWEKLMRARELLEAEQAHVRDDRLNLKETAALLKRHEAALTAREAGLAQREAILTAAMTAAVPVEGNRPSTMTRLTHAPFAIAKSVFGSKSPMRE